jgi:predicted regulator of amino acid metabolism with ACT domain
MNTRKTVYGKLFKEETQLASHEVELKSVQVLNEIEANNQKVIDEVMQVGQQLKKLSDSIDSWQKKYDLARRNADKALADFKQNAQELGLLNEAKAPISKAEASINSLIDINKRFYGSLKMLASGAKLG